MSRRMNSSPLGDMIGLALMRQPGVKVALTPDQGLMTVQIPGST